MDLADGGGLQRSTAMSILGLAPVLAAVSAIVAVVAAAVQRGVEVVEDLGRDRGNAEMAEQWLEVSGHRVAVGAAGGVGGVYRVDVAVQQLGDGGVSSGRSSVNSSVRVTSSAWHRSRLPAGRLVGVPPADRPSAVILLALVAAIYSRDTKRRRAALDVQRIAPSFCLMFAQLLATVFGAMLSLLATPNRVSDGSGDQLRWHLARHHLPRQDDASAEPGQRGLRSDGGR